jgi:hypothetical protein
MTVFTKLAEYYFLYFFPMTVSSSHTKLYLALSAIIIIIGIFVIYEIIRTSEVSTTTSSTPLISLQNYTIPLSGTEPTLGNPGAPNTIILFADLGSKDSRNAFTTLTDFVMKYPDQFKLIWKDAPESTLFFTNSIRAHVGAWCAEKQHKFWPFAEQVFTSRSYLSDTKLTDLASKLSLNIPTWSQCFTATPSLTVWSKTGKNCEMTGNIVLVRTVFDFI